MVMSIKPAIVEYRNTRIQFVQGTGLTVVQPISGLKIGLTLQKRLATPPLEDPG